MVLKLQTNKGWKYIDNVIQSDTSTVIKEREKYPVFESVISIQEQHSDTLTPEGMIPETANPAFAKIEISAVRSMGLVKSAGEYETLLIYTELPAYLLNDKGETIERLN